MGSCDEALRLIEEHEFDLIGVDWREVLNLGEFLGSVRRSKLNQECVLVAIVRHLLDLRQAFAAGVKFLIHKPPRTIQIERCLRAACSATLARRRKHHRESVNFAASVGARNRPYSEVTVVNLSEAGVGIKLQLVDGGARFSDRGGRTGSALCSAGEWGYAMRFRHRGLDNRRSRRDPFHFCA